LGVLKLQDDGGDEEQVGVSPSPTQPPHTVDHRKLSADAREPLLDAIAERIRTRLDDRVPRRYLSMLRTGQRAD